MEVSNKKRTKNIDTPYEEMAVSCLNVVMEDIAGYMQWMMVDRYRHIDQLIGKRVASFYIKDIN